MSLPKDFSGCVFLSLLIFIQFPWKTDIVTETVLQVVLLGGDVRVFQRKRTNRKYVKICLYVI